MRLDDQEASRWCARAYWRDAEGGGGDSSWPRPRPGTVWTSKCRPPMMNRMDWSPTHSELSPLSVWSSIHANILYAGQRGWLGPGRGVFRSQDAGQTWENMNSNLPVGFNVWSLTVSRLGGMAVGAIVPMSLEPASTGNAKTNRSRVVLFLVSLGLVGCASNPPPPTSVSQDVLTGWSSLTI